jgi:hypothetical protein
MFNHYYEARKNQERKRGGVVRVKIAGNSRQTPKKNDERRSQNDH